MLFVQPGLLPEETQKTKDKQQEKPSPSRYVCANCHTPVSDASCLLVIQGDSPNPPQSGKTPGLLAMLGRFSIAQVVKSTWAGATMVPQSQQDSMGLSVNDLLKWRRSRTSGSIHEDIPADVGWLMLPVG